MLTDYLTITTPLLVALLMGGLIGLERAWHGRPAGLRTHTLVCVSSSLLMLLTVYQWDLLSATVPLEAIRIDPTRMAQGIMTGIGFLGAGVIMKEKLTIRGLTTAASIWMTASIGIMVGLGFYSSAVSATVLTLIVLSLFGRLENMLPARRFGNLILRYKTSDESLHEDIDSLIAAHNIKAYHPSYHLDDEGRILEYSMTIYTNNVHNFRKLAESLQGAERLVEFSITPSGN
ncbi:MgtC/SapB family protein [Sulfuriflexus sp.]|uniref:MgtC/SapB family protein n=1 Tax=Sulfuriflexus sp. TaxID=2015443 RepID=UPI0028CF5F6C|nr:MgtC/SapB family protein [Sulfuriflexus sp.]MDT8405137.1 MgtC/SapB family protein [Sulfuriflexus sp.]